MRRQILLLAVGLAAALTFAATPTYYPSALGDFDGTNDYLSRTSDLVGNADSKVCIQSYWVRFDGGDGDLQAIFSSWVGWGAVKGPDNFLAFQQVTGGEQVLVQSTQTLLAGSGWHHVLFSVDVANAVSHLYIDDVDVANEITNNNVLLSWTNSDWAIGAQAFSGAMKLNGALAELYFNTAEYLDFSVTANRRKFIDDSGYPVDLGPSGYKPTGTAPIVYMRTQFNNAGLNSGTGGNFTINGAPAYTMGPVPYGGDSYTNTHTAGTVAIGNFDGTNDYLERTSDLAGNANGKVGTVSYWCRIDGGDAANRMILEASAGRFAITLTDGNKFRVMARSDAGTFVLSQETATTYVSGGGWYHVLHSWDLANAKTYIYVNDVSRGDTPIFLVDGDIDYTRPAWGIGAKATGTYKWNGAIAELYFALEYLDISIEANRRKFSTADLKPVDLGPSGYKPTGTAPIIYMGTQYNNAGENSGTGGDFTIMGSPTDTEGPVSYGQSYTATHIAGTTALDFDGTNNYMWRGSDLTGDANSKVGIVSAWVKLVDDKEQRIFANKANRFMVSKQPDNKISIRGANNANETLMERETVGTYGAEWIHILSSWDLGADEFWMYIDDVSDGGSGTLINQLLGYTFDTWSIGASGAGTTKVEGAISELYFNVAEKMDFSVTANRRRFIGEDGYPVYLGEDGYKPTGTAPIVYMKTQYNDGGENSGTGGDFGFDVVMAPSYAVGPVPFFLTMQGARGRSSQSGRGRRAR